MPRRTARRRKPDDAKFRELLLYVAKRSESDPDFSDTKLNKILFFEEFLAYGRTGRAITWQPFQKLAWARPPGDCSPFGRGWRPPRK